MALANRKGDVKKSPIWYSSRFWVCLYAIVMVLLISGQFILGLLEDNKITFHNITLNKFINGECNLPMEIAAWCWSALISLFCGFDRFVDIKTTMHLSSGQMSMGDLSKLRVIIMESLLLFIYSLICSLLVNKDFQLTAMFSAFGMSVIIYVAGNKAVKACKYYSDKEDKDSDGVPDIIQKDYEKWVRAQKRNGVDEAYINLDYFLDDNPEIEAKLDGVN